MRRRLAKIKAKDVRLDTHGSGVYLIVAPPRAPSIMFKVLVLAASERYKDPPGAVLEVAEWWLRCDTKPLEEGST